MNPIKYMFMVLLLCTISEASFSQEQTIKPLSIGKQIPGAIWKSIPLKKNAKLVILDFWATSCAVCMEAFPKIEKLQQQFPDVLQIVLVNSWETDAQVKKRLDQINKNKIKNQHEPIRIPSLFAINGDSIFKKLFPASSIPHHVWISKDGIVQAITYAHNATSEHIQAFLDGKKLNMEVKIKDDLASEKLINQGYLQPTIPQTPVVYYSAFVPYSKIREGSTNIVDTVHKIFRRTFDNYGIMEHLMTAYSNPNNDFRILKELKRKDILERPKDGNLIDEWNNKYAFTYTLQIPLKDRNTWQTKMRSDFEYYFGNFYGIECKLENRKLRSLVIIKTREASLPNSNGNNLFGDLIGVLTRNLEDMEARRPVIDESGIASDLEVDIQLSGDLKDVNNVRKQLQAYGLNIVEEEREVEVLVIKDKK